MPTPPFNATVQLKLPGIAPDDLIGVWDNVTNYDTSVDPMVFDNEEGTLREWPKSEYILVIRDSLGAIVENSGDNTDPASSVEVPENVVDEVNRVAANLKDTGSVNKSLREDGSYQDVPVLFSFWLRITILMLHLEARLTTEVLIRAILILQRCCHKETTTSEYLLHADLQQHFKILHIELLLILAEG